MNLKSLDLLKFSEVLKKRPFRASLERTVLRQLVAVILNFFKCSSPCLLSLKVIWSFYFYSSHLSQLAFSLYTPSIQRLHLQLLLAHTVEAGQKTKLLLKMLILQLIFRMTFLEIYCNHSPICMLIQRRNLQ